MDSRTGKAIRRGRILRPETGRGVVIAASHGVLTGPPRGLRTRTQILDTMRQLHRSDAVMIAPGMVALAEQTFVGRDSPGLVIEIDWKSWNRETYPANHEGRGEGATARLSSIEAASAAGVDAVMSYLYVGQLDPHLERAEIERNARYVEACERFGINLIIEPRSAQEGIDGRGFEAATIEFYCRVAAELGADLVKCVWPGSIEALDRVVEATFVPVLLAGGPGDETLEGAAALAEAAMAAGAAGVMFGRKVYRAEDPSVVVDRLLEIVHGSEA